jgi:very-short-patch-repair endonuclease
MSLALTRLQSLIEYAQQSALLRLSPQTDVSRHGQFTEFEHSISGLPGVHFDDNSEESEDEIWLTVDRLTESPAPQPESALLKVWLDVTNNPTKEPDLVSHIEAEKLIAIGALAVPSGTVAFDPKQLTAFASFAQKDSVEGQFKAYLANVWKPWAAEEKRRRRTISLYAKLFTLKQQLEGGIVDAQLELVWGIGMAVWNMQGTQVSYPVISKLVEISLNQTTMAIEVRPRELDPRLELGIYSVVDNPSVPSLEAIGKEFFAKATTTISPFDHSTYEPLLRSAVTNLDPKGVYWPTQVAADDRTLPKATEDLKVTDTWVLFARPKSASVFIQDLEQFKKQLGDDNGEPSDLTNTVLALVTDPLMTNDEIKLPGFRGLSIVGGDYTGESGGKLEDLFFPMPFNDEQVQIVQLLERFDGVVVQGPPGTGKTHTIANVICHYLASGKKVLVTSMKDPALTVLKEKLPEEIRPLAISVLTSEQEGMKQFEHAISKIASEVQRINRGAMSQEIAQIESRIDSYHAKLAKVDAQIGDWAVKNLKPITIDDDTIEPREAAEEIVASQHNLDWLADAITIAPNHKVQFSDGDINQLRETRRVLGKDLDYLNAALPAIASFPDSHEVLRVHQDMVRSAQLKTEVDSGLVPPLVNSSKATFENAQALCAKLSNLKLLRQTIINANAAWTDKMQLWLRSNSKEEVQALFEVLGSEIETASDERKQFLSKPVAVPDDIDQNDIIILAVQNLAHGKRPFGIAGIVGKGPEKKILDAIRVVNSAPAALSDWQHVFDYLNYLKKQRALLTRWNSLAGELRLPTFTVTPTEFPHIVENFDLYKKLKEAIALEKNVVTGCRSLLPSWDKIDAFCDEMKLADDAERYFVHHLTQNSLAETWALKERFQQILAGCDGRVVKDIRDFLDHALGNPAFEVSVVQAQWSQLMEELRRVHGLKSHLQIVETVTHRIEESGAPLWAERLRTEFSETVDHLLPSNWRQCWRLKRLTTYLNAIDGRSELKKLGVLRHETESDLAKAYQEIVSKRTWLKLSENANPGVRAALKAYMAAMAKIGKGTGKRAVRYRQDARKAALMANPAIPCWIMRHDRISETLPPQFGCFDLVVIDEASQSDLTALPAILRAKKILVVGDDKQVSPEGVGLEEEKIRHLMSRFLSSQVELYRAQMSPDRSIYDLFKVVFAASGVMLREHFRCVAPIIEYSKREFYNHELKALRLPKASERMDPPLVDVLIEDGYRKGDINMAEARFIVNEIKAIASDPKYATRSIGVVSLLGDKQALKIWEMLEPELGHELITRHQIACGDAKTFQGKERDIMFLTMIVSRGNATAIGREAFAQRFNVAASRARDKMYLVRSVTVEDLSEADYLRRGLIGHFSTPFAQDADRVKDLRQLCESPFEREVYDILTERGYRITPQVPVGEFRLDMVVEGQNDARLAIECDGDRYHGLDQWENDMRRQRILERAGWRFWRCFASTFVMNRQTIIDDLLQCLNDHGIQPLGATEFVQNPHVETRRISSTTAEEEILENVTEAAAVAN